VLVLARIAMKMRTGVTFLFSAPCTVLSWTKVCPSDLASNFGPRRTLRQPRRALVISRVVLDSEKEKGDQKTAAPPTPAQTESPQEKKGHMSISTLLSEYGLIALAFHFTVWISCVALVFTALSFGFNLDGLPFIGSEVQVMETTADAVLDITADAIGTSAAAAESGASLAAKVGATLAIVEVVGPLRLALTVAVTPAVSKVVRQFAVVRATEAKILEWISALQAFVKRLTGEMKGAGKEL